MNEIEFIPLVELPTKKDAESEIIPKGTSIDNPDEWDIYQKRELGKNYLNIPRHISTGIYQYRLFELDIEDIERAIKLHISDIDINESCSLFGGYAISINGIIELYPQCCGLLEEIQEWKKILDVNFTEFYLKECHPSPQVTKKGSEIIILCKDNYESFFPLATKEIIKLDYEKTRLAFIKLIKELTYFSTKLDALSSKFKIAHISNILVWGDNALN